MHLWVAREAVEEMGHLEGAAVGLLVQRQVAALGHAGDRFGQLVRAREKGQPLGDAPDLRLRDAQDLGDLGKRAAGPESGEAAHHGDALAPEALEDEVHDVVFAVVGEIHVDVGQLVERHAVFVQEAAEVEVEADGADAADLQAVAGERIGGAAARDPVDAAAAAFLQDVPHDQEVFLVADVGDDGQLLLDLRPEPGVVTRITAPEPLHDEPAQEGRGRGTILRIVAGELRLAGRQGEGAAVGNLATVREQLGMGGEELLHFGCGAKMVFAVQSFLRMRLPQESQRANALHHVIFPTVGRLGVVDG